MRRAPDENFEADPTEEWNRGGKNGKGAVWGKAPLQFVGLALLDPRLSSSV